VTTKEKQLIFQAIDICEERHTRICENYANLNPEHRKRIETNRDLFLFATTLVRMEIERTIGADERRAKA